MYRIIELSGTDGATSYEIKTALNNLDAKFFDKVIKRLAKYKVGRFPLVVNETEVIIFYLIYTLFIENGYSFVVAKKDTDITLAIFIGIRVW
jgi:hypothetical protein